MTMPSRGISDIQEKARGNKMKKSKMPMMGKKGSPMDKMSVGAMSSKSDLGMKKGGSCSGYKKGGSIDGIAKKGKTKGKLV
jgi:hypothetical protein